MTHRPSSVRWYVLGVTTLASFLLYLDRICVGVAAKSITLEFNATRYDGWFVGVFFWSYALCQVPAGMLSDRFGIRRMLMVYILAWSVFTAALGLATSFWMLIVFRLLCGMAQAGAYPSAARAIRDWMPFTLRGTASSVVALGGRFGGAVAPALTLALMLYFGLQSVGPALRPDELVDAASVLEKLPADGFVVNGKIVRPQNSTEELLRYLNAIDVLNADGVFPLPFPEEAQRLVQRARSAETLGEPERARLNRQLLEILFPKAVKKLEGRGWRPVMLVYGALGILVAAGFWMVFREQPAQHPWCNDAERELIARAPVAQQPAISRAGFPWRVVLTDRGMWGNCLSQFGTNVGWVFLVATLPRYLEDVHHVPALQRGLLSSLPLLFGMPALLIGGPWTDFFARRFGLRWGRRLPIVVTRLAAAGGHGLCILVLLGLFGPLTGTLAITVAIIAMCLASMGTDLGVPAVWAFAQDVGGRHTAAILGWGNMWGNFGAAAAPPLYSLVLGQNPNEMAWIAVFAICGGGFLAAGLGAIAMDASRPIERPADAESS